jgi:hypothetical protein
LARYAGVYRDDGYGEVRVTVDNRVENGALAIEWAGARGPLEHFHYDTFQAREGRVANERVVFHVNGAAAVSSLTFLDVEFRRVQ